MYSMSSHYVKRCINSPAQETVQYDSRNPVPVPHRPAAWCTRRRRCRSPRRRTASGPGRRAGRRPWRTSRAAERSLFPFLLIQATGVTHRLGRVDRRRSVPAIPPTGVASRARCCVVFSPSLSWKARSSSSVHDRPSLERM